MHSVVGQVLYITNMHSLIVGMGGERHTRHWRVLSRRVLAPIRWSRRQGKSCGVPSGVPEPDEPGRDGGSMKVRFFRLDPSLNGPGSSAGSDRTI
ncbi:hypothetical protein B0T26DRAFT_708124 [Lasiosphaeria miniovina]|uniref:Uncharacterized protein n=1 Tax=Lasiosphaeria miniovina TaxID=1954250 RepID=A0AA40DVD9_9PEZI|nr:uncharacterized protein B0T26DRAFT_708124 [Lasiosphaeria miniovina]KAK0717020.1 hypothetical protein B0T26DRAFT_708124 [Lasiosphaeria miniovina]